VSRFSSNVSNWAGIIFAPAQFDHIGASWTVPAVQSSNANEGSGTWVGIDGADNQNLIQTGTAQWATPQGNVYYAWYEILPEPEQVLGPVTPGDLITTSIDKKEPGTWTISIQDETSAENASGQVAYNGPADSAEWIVEAPTDSSGNMVPLADFGRVRFSNPSAAGTGSPKSYAAEMTDSAGNVIAYPTNVTSSSFDVDFGAPTQSSPPPSSATPPPATSSSPPPAMPSGAASSQSHGVGLDCAQAGGDQRTPAQASVQPGIVAIVNWTGYTQYGEAPQYQAETVDSSGHTQDIGSVSIPRGAHLVQAWQDSTNCYGSDISRNAWVAAADGHVYGENDFSGPPANNFGDMAGKPLNQPIVGMSPTADGQGYWLVASDGGIFTFGDAHFYGSTGAIHLNQPIVAMAVTPDGGGYWLAASDGGIFTFGDAGYYGSTGNIHLNQPVEGMIPTPDGQGYWMVASDGGIFTFGEAPFKGSAGNRQLTAPIAGMIPNGTGYTLVGQDGQTYPFT